MKSHNLLSVRFALSSGPQPIQQPLPGWKIKKVVARYETFYLFALVSRAGHLLWSPRPTVPKQAGPSDGGEDLKGISASEPGFDRGMFSIPINHGTLRFALMPPYLQTLGFSKEGLGSR